MGKFLTLLKNSVKPMIDEGSPIALEATIDGIVGQIASGLVSFKLSYQQKRFEENTKAALSSLFQRSRRLERRFDELSEEFLNYIQDKALPITLDYAIEEREQEKIELIINGLESIVEMASEDSLVLTYNDVLKELRLNEVRALLAYDLRRVPERRALDLSLALDRSPEGRERYRQIQGLDAYIDGKLLRLNLLEAFAEAGEVIGTPQAQKKRLTQFGKNFIDFFKIDYSNSGD